MYVFEVLVEVAPLGAWLRYERLEMNDFCEAIVTTDCLIIGFNNKRRLTRQTEERPKEALITVQPFGVLA